MKIHWSRQIVLHCHIEKGYFVLVTHQICDTNHERYEMSVAIKNDWGHIQGHVDRAVLLTVTYMPTVNDAEVVAKKMGVAYG